MIKVASFINFLIILCWHWTQCDCLICISEHCRNIGGCPTQDGKGLRQIFCPEDGSCFLKVKIQSDNDKVIITERIQGCATSWSFMKSNNGSMTCFDGPEDEHKTCLCSNKDMCNCQLGNVAEYRRLHTQPFPPQSNRKIDCIESGIVYSDQAYCSYRRSIGARDHWIRRAHASGHVSLLENSQRDHLCFQDGKEIDCYCKTDLCNERVPPPGVLQWPSFIGTFDEKITCCKSEIDYEIPVYSDNPRKFKTCASEKNSCLGDYCFIKFRYHILRKTILGRQTCYNTSSQLIATHDFDGSEYGFYRERTLYCRNNFCNQFSVVLQSISAEFLDVYMKIKVVCY